VKLEVKHLPTITMPTEVLTKVIQGLVKNAVENTPDEGNVRVLVTSAGKSAALEVRDFGVGILPDHQIRIFEGFYPTQKTDAYSSKQPFDFNAGGKGADLLRMKIFSERFGFTLAFKSQRCRYLPSSADVCPGEIARCADCRRPEDCFNSGGSSFKVIFPAN
jgi:light-regulated signal transduction histidine kinase (bacteriophytochrome)